MLTAELDACRCAQLSRLARALGCTLLPARPPACLPACPQCPMACPSCRYDERLLDLQQQRDELQRERADLMSKLESLQHASGGWVGGLGRLDWLVRRCAPLVSTGGGCAARVWVRGSPHNPLLSIHSPAEEERLRLREQYEARIKLLDEKVKAVRAKVGWGCGWQPGCLVSEACSSPTA